MGANWNFYVFIGGTNWGFMSGANGGGELLQPQPTSYDYDAPLSEAGDMTEKYKAIRDRIGQWKKLPQYDVQDSKKANYGTIRFTERASLWENLDLFDEHVVKGVHPFTFENLGVDYGFVLIEKNYCRAARCESARCTIARTCSWTRSIWASSSERTAR